LNNHQAVIMEKTKSESGVSELIGAILLVSLVVMLMAVVTTVLISQPRPEKIPEISASISVNSNIVNITHMGGDELGAKEYLIVINGIPQTNVQIVGGTTWSIEHPQMVVTVPNSVIPVKTVEVYYNGPSTQVLLLKTVFQ
jgi:hypothetical protein